MDYMHKITLACAGAVISFFTGLPVIAWVLIGTMTLDYLTGIVVASMGKSRKTEGGGLSSRVAVEGLMRKVVMLFVVALACLVDLAVASSAGLLSFSAISGAVCLWFIASEGMSILENAAEIGLPIPNVITQALEVLKVGNKNDN